MSANTYKAVHAGLRRGSDALLVCLWIKLDADGALTGEQLFFARKGKKTRLTDAWIGDIYEIEDTDGSCRCPNPRIGQWEDKEQRAAWKLEEQAAETSVNLDKLAAKDDWGGMTLDEVKAKLDKTIGRARRAALIALVLEYLT